MARQGARLASITPSRPAEYPFAPPTSAHERGREFDRLSAMAILRPFHAVLLMTLLALSARAGPILLVPGSLDDVNAFNTNNTKSDTLATSASGSVDYTGTVTSDGVIYDLTGSSEAAPGILRATSSFTSDGTDSFYSQFNAAAGYNDILTITAAGLAGQQGFLLPVFAISGSASTNAALHFLLIWQDSVSDASTQIQMESFTGNGTSTFNPIGFHYGQPLGFGQIIGADIFPSGTTSGSADFGDTVLLTGLQVFDADGNPVATVSFSAVSGAVYTQSGIVPEPATFALMGFALGALWLSALKRCTVRKN